LGQNDYSKVPNCKRNNREVGASLSPQTPGWRRPIKAKEEPPKKKKTIEI